MNDDMYKSKHDDSAISEEGRARVEELRKLREELSGSAKQKGWELEQMSCGAFTGDPSEFEPPTTDEEARVALTWFSDWGVVDFVRRIKSSPGYISTLPDKVVQTIIRALQQCRTEPCPTCDGTGSIKPFGDGYAFSPGIFGISYSVRYCHDCGRKLGDRHD